MSSFINSIIGSVKENIGYMTGNEEMEASGRQTKNQRQEDVTNPPKHDPLTESFARDEIKSEASATSSQEMMDQMHAQPTREFNSEETKPTLVPIKPHEAFHSEGVSVDPDYNSSTTKSGWTDKIKADIRGYPDSFPSEKQPDSKPEEESVMDKLRNAHMEAVNKDENNPSNSESWKEKITSFLSANELPKQSESSSVMDSLRDAHGEAVMNNQEKSSTDTWKEKFTEMKDSVTSRIMPNYSHEKSTIEKVEDKMLDIKDKVISSTNNESSTQVMPDPLPSKADPIAIPGDIPDPNFLQNA